MLCLCESTAHSAALPPRCNIHPSSETLGQDTQPGSSEKYVKVTMVTTRSGGDNCHALDAGKINSWKSVLNECLFAKHSREVGFPSLAGLWSDLGVTGQGQPY